MSAEIIAVDFDGTLCTNKWPEIGKPIQNNICALKDRKQEGAILILWTMREGDMLDKAVAWCKEQGLQFDYINDNTDEIKTQFGSNPRKVFVNEYWDDHNGERIQLCCDCEHRNEGCQESWGHMYCPSYEYDDDPSGEGDGDDVD